MRPQSHHSSEHVLMAALVMGGLGIVAAPLACLWVASRFEGAGALALAALGAPLVVVLWSVGLSRLNRKYLRVSAHPLPVLEFSVTAAVMVAIVGALAWMLLFGERGPDIPLRTS